MKKTDFLIIGAGIFGLATAIELAKRKHSVCLLNPDQIPHPLAASTDISKVVRMEYGTDTEYMDMAAESILGWRDWNDLFKDTLYHETGFLLAATKALETDKQAFEGASYANLLKKGFQPERLDTAAIKQRFPAFSTGRYVDGFYHKVGGFVESGRAVSTLLAYARQLGVDVQEGQTAAELILKNKRITGVKTEENAHFKADNVIVCAGNFTPYLVPDLLPYMYVTGHPVFHLKPSKPQLFTAPNMAVFTADISNTGWYGFPLHPREKVIKIAVHAKGQRLHPAHDERIVTATDTANLRRFLKHSLPALAEDPVVYTRRCCYTDTLDGHFWIDQHPEIKGLTIGSGGSGHGLKMAPIIGDMIAMAAEGNSHKWSARYRWRDLKEGTVQVEEARAGFDSAQPSKDSAQPSKDSAQPSKDQRISGSNTVFG